MAEVAAPDNRCELTNLTKSCILHSLHILFLKRDKLQREQIQKFCKELCEIASKITIKGDKRSQQRVTLEKPLQIDAGEFEKGLLTVKDIFPKIEHKVIKCIRDGDLDYNSLFRVCWKAYRLEKRPDSEVTEFSSQHPEPDHCMYSLWLVFNAILSPESDEIRISVKCLDEVMRRVFDLCGHECTRDELEYSSSKGVLEYLEYLKAIANYNAKFDLKKTLTCEVIQDLKDEIVDAVLKKSYLTKKGHKIKTWRRRWFVLKKTIMRYYESKEKPVLKGQMVINAGTEVRERDNIGRRMYCFEVICGQTKKRFEMSADDEKSRHEWILAIKKAISLAKILSGSEDEEITEHSSNPYLSNFYLIKFGASQSIIPKWEGGIKQVFDCSQSGNFSEDEEEQSKLCESIEGPTAGSIASTTSVFIRDNANELATEDYPSSTSSDVSNKESLSSTPKASPAYNRRQKLRSNPNALSDTDQAESLSFDTTKVNESVAVNGVKEITESSASDRQVEDIGELVSTEASATQVRLAETGETETYGLEDAPTAATTAVPTTSRPHAQTFLDKMQGLAFQAGAVPDFEGSYCDL